ncbi:MAG: YraN family protein [Candidatus Omnitrophica bacterium]|nr:YraN family protein [Candidatus Omnitrophota bacterium]MCM8770523.1 YraN family protein [Candidatus Omnitrophota bacterium]
MLKHNQKLARWGEHLARDFLKAKNYKILETNFRCRLGELDIIAQDKDTICFIEVKTRRTDKFGSPYEAVDRSKQKKMCQVALVYLKNKGWLDKPARFDVVSIAAQEAKIGLIKNAFALDNHHTY